MWLRKIKICELMGFVEIIWAIKAKYVSLLKLACWCKFSARYYRSYVPMNPYTNPPKVAWNMGSSEHNRGNISSLIGGKVLNFSMEAFCILFFRNITTKSVISQIKFLWRHRFRTCLLLLKRLKKLGTKMTAQAWLDRIAVLVDRIA